MFEASDVDELEKIHDLAEIENLIGYHSFQEQAKTKLRQFGMAQHHRNMQEILCKLKEHILAERSKAHENPGT